MAGNGPKNPIENEALTPEMRGLLMIATVEERRKPTSRKRSGPDGEKRRRTDEAAEPKKRGS